MKGLLQRCDLTPDTGSLKNTSGQYDFLQNVRGFGGLIAKRNGILNIDELDAGVMGIFDMYRDGDPTSPDKVLVVDGDGDFQVYDWTELTTVFNYVISDGGTYYQQSADNSWWQIYPDSGTGQLVVAGVAAPTSTRSTDLIVAQGEIFGSVDGTTTWRFFVENTYPPVANAVQEYGAVSADATFSSIAFTKAVGLVFELDTLERYRVGVDNAGALTLTGI